MASIRITGLEAIARAFRELEPKLAKRVVRQAERNSLKTPYAQAKATWPVLSGQSKKTVRIRTAKGPRGSRSHTIATALLVGEASNGKAKKNGSKRVWWPFLIEQGFHTGGKRIRHGGKTIGYTQTRASVGVKKIAGRHIMRRTLRSNESTIRQVMTNAIVQGIEKITRG
jgi:hypothetical protein